LSLNSFRVSSITSCVPSTSSLRSSICSHKSSHRSFSYLTWWCKGIFCSKATHNAAIQCIQNSPFFSTDKQLPMATGCCCCPVHHPSLEWWFSHVWNNLSHNYMEENCKIIVICWKLAYDSKEFNLLRKNL
jgi:hypothetical protein